MSALLPLIVIVAGLVAGVGLLPVLRPRPVLLTRLTRTPASAARRIEPLNVR